ncbi:3-hydroxyisobutyryl-CoA hydrolase, mitochondrial [Smittium mucronatum]|uniref:3-hydroxyisobutyryl-CoA hydrolase n=1 Tax=Smittium mucronatum TaxID=133383 RepID=A0A1R0H0Y9_9FUNG|nr:3-hydroxyisobutyryl-CoA hydrolase, mitochondrial [Smittium mucronatum]
MSAHDSSQVTLHLPISPPYSIPFFFDSSPISFFCSIIFNWTLPSCSRYIILNRPKALNALNDNMLSTIGTKLREWEVSELCNNIIIKSSNPKFYCSGGDVVSAAKKIIENPTDSNIAKYFTNEYSVNHILATVKKPTVAIISGVTMGGGVGISVHAPFRVATENTLFAMPETLIGFFPDVGASFYLPRLDSELGTFLGLTGQRLQGRDVFFAGIASHYIPQERIPLLEARLNELGSSSLEAVNAALEESSGEPDPEYSFSLAPYMNSINNCFKYDSVEEIYDALRNEKSNPEWAQKTIQTLDQMSPSSLKISLELVRRGRSLSLRDCLEMESQLASKVIFAPDFIEGISELLLKKTKQPKWNPSSLSEISRSDIISKFFSNPTPEAQIQFASPSDYSQYPFKHFSLPSYEDVRSVVVGEDPSVGDVALSAQEIIDMFVNRYNDKIGVREKVTSILKSNTSANADYTDFNTVTWISK